MLTSRRRAAHLNLRFSADPQDSILSMDATVGMALCSRKVPHSPFLIDGRSRVRMVESGSAHNGICAKTSQQQLKDSTETSRMGLPLPHPAYVRTHRSGLATQKQSMAAHSVVHPPPGAANTRSRRPTHSSSSMHRCLRSRTQSRQPSQEMARGGWRPESPKRAATIAEHPGTSGGGCNQRPASCSIGC